MSLKRLHALGKRAGLDHEGLREVMRTRWPGKKSLTDLSSGELDSLCRQIALRSRPKRVAPRGKVREEGTIVLASPAQKRRIALWLQRLLDQPNQTEEGVRWIIQRIMGSEFLERLPAPIRSTRDYADAVHTGPEAQILIKSLYGELRRRGLLE